MKDLQTLLDDFIESNYGEVSNGDIADYFYRLGKSDMKEQMMEDAVEIEVKEDAGGFPIVPLDAIELYDYEKDKPLAKAGDKVKLIVIKEEDEK